MNAGQLSDPGGPAGARRRAFVLLEPTAGSRLQPVSLGYAKTPILVGSALVAVILINSVVLVLWTAPDLASACGFWFRIVEYCTVSVFLAEYALKFWTAPEAARDPARAGWRQRYVVSLHALVDAAALAPSAAGWGWPCASKAVSC